MNLVDPIFFDPASRSALDLLLGAYGYAVQIYCDFSAYSDMAVGLAALLGYRFPRNFDQPYRAESLQDFWRRWHISLSTWLRDYLYISLGGNRSGLWMICRNLIITMVLGGIWHGAKWTFLIWGALHGLVLAAERIWRDMKPPGWPLLPRPIAVFITFHIVTLGWIFFRAPDFAVAITYLSGILSLRAGPVSLSPLLGVLVTGGMAIHFVPPGLLPRLAGQVARLPAPALGLGLGGLVLIIDAMRFQGVAAFIYYQF